MSDEIASSSGFDDGSSSAPGVSFDSISPLIELANGRACSIIFSAPFSLDAATIFMALVILAVDRTDFIRMPIALIDGMVHQPATRWGTRLETLVPEAGEFGPAALHSPRRAEAELAEPGAVRRPRSPPPAPLDPSYLATPGRDAQSPKLREEHLCLNHDAVALGWFGYHPLTPQIDR